jgi:phenylpropionate dioxygenase-like ring-hydroxylating dioxygenase large terminal subunit
MTGSLKLEDSLPNIPENFIPKEPYLSAEFARREKERLWPKAWLLACREEEVKQPGDYVVFDIADESIIVVKDEEHRLHAFFNVCQHRGRQLVDHTGCGHTLKFFCKYHGWRWDLDGTNDVIIDRADWADALNADGVSLKPLKLGRWGGFVFVNMDSEAVPLETYLAPLISAFRNYDLQDLRYRWKRSVRLDCNWKVAIDVFIEGYHAQTAHRQYNLHSGDAHYSCELFGPHSVFRYRDMPIIGQSNANIGLIGNLPQDDVEKNSKANTLPQRLLVYFSTLNKDMDALVSDRFVRAVQRLADELPPDTSYWELMGALQNFHREEGRKDGIAWDKLTIEDIVYLGMDWSIFPNIALLPQTDAVLMYRARPDGDNPDSCFLEIWSLERCAPGQEPEVVEGHYNNWKDFKWPRIFVQDFESVPFVQKGMKSQGFTGGLPNPIAEKTVDNFHRHVREAIAGASF